MKLTLKQLRTLINEAFQRLDEDTCPCGIERSDCEYHKSNIMLNSSMNITLIPTWETRAGEVDEVYVVTTQKELKQALSTMRVHHPGSNFDVVECVRWPRAHGSGYKYFLKNGKQLFPVRPWVVLVEGDPVTYGSGFMGPHAIADGDVEQLPDV